MATTLLASDLPGLNLVHRGKVRDVFDLGDGHLLMVATDRLSAFDVVLPDPIPGKGEMLCQISNFWFDRTRHIIANHLTGIDVASVLPAGTDAALYAKRAVVTKKLKPVPVECIARGYIIGRSWKDYRRRGAISGINRPAGTDAALYAKRAVVTKKLKPVPVECIARGYIIGSGWKDYRRSGAISGINLPAGLQQAQQLPEPIFTPSTKAAVGDHDENIDFA